MWGFQRLIVENSRYLLRILAIIVIFLKNLSERIKEERFGINAKVL